MINYSFDYIDYPSRFDRIVNDNLRRIMSMPIEELNKWLNLNSTQDKLSFNQQKILETVCPSLYDFIDEKVNG